MILTWLILIPIIGAIFAWAIAHRSVTAARVVSLVAMLIDLVLGIYLWSIYPVSAAPGAMFIRQSAEWVPQLGISYSLGIDGLSILMIVLTALLGVVSVLASWREINERVGAFHFAMLALLSGIIGVFLAQDLLLFYFFWELMLIPMYFLIGIWGHENRVYASIKFFLFTFISGLFMLISIIGLYIVHGRATGNYTFDYATLLHWSVPARYGMLLMLGFFVAFVTKLPAFPVHTWLPDAHTEAPTAGSVILAGLMLKTGAYGLIRFAVPLFPDASSAISTIAMALGVVGIIYGAVLAYAQSDLKRLVAYTSVSHLGFVLLGIYSGSRLAMQGAVMEMVAHGISTGALFLIAGMLQERTHTRDFAKLDGLWATIPKMGGFTLLFSLAALGLPGLGNFIGEFLVLLGVFQVNQPLAIIASLGFVVSVIYALRLMRRSMQGPNNHSWSLRDINLREGVVLATLALIIFWLGLYPNPIFRTASSSIVATWEDKR